MIFKPRNDWLFYNGFLGLFFDWHSFIPAFYHGQNHLEAPV